MALLALAGCGATHAPLSVHSPSVPRATPTASPFTLYTHCGIREARIGQHFYLAAKPLGDGNGNPPAGWDNPFQEGTMTVTSPTTAVFRDAKGHRVTFRVRRGATEFLQICS